MAVNRWKSSTLTPVAADIIQGYAKNFRTVLPSFVVPKPCLTISKFEALLKPFFFLLEQCVGTAGISIFLNSMLWYKSNKCNTHPMKRIQECKDGNPNVYIAHTKPGKKVCFWKSNAKKNLTRLSTLLKIIHLRWIFKTYIADRVIFLVNYSVAGLFLDHDALQNWFDCTRDTKNFKFFIWSSYIWNVFLVSSNVLFF